MICLRTLAPRPHIRLRSVFVLLAIVLLPMAAPASAQPWTVHEALTAQEYDEIASRKMEEGAHLVDFSAYSVNNQVQFAAVWDTTSGPAWRVHRDLAPSKYKSTQKEMASEGYAPVSVSGYVADGQPRLAIRWEEGIASDRTVRQGLSPDEYAAALKQMSVHGYQPIDVSAYVVDGQPQFAGVWEKSETTRTARLGLSPDTYESGIRPQMQSKGFYPVDVSGYVVDGQTHYVGIWKKGADKDRTVRLGLTPRNYESTFWNLVYRGHRPVQVAGYAGPEHAQMAGIWEDAHPDTGLSDQDLTTIRQRVQSFMDTYEVPGLSIAIAKNERLVFAQGYGTAIKEDSVRTGPHHRFRIASVSKPVTSAAILRLWDNGQLRLDQTVLGPDGLLGTRLGDEPYGPNEKKVTVRHLLNHTTGGWSKDRSGPDSEPMFQHKDLSREELLGWVLDSQNLDQAPGSEYAYSNVGYSLLGRVIEAVSGQSYEAYVKQNVLRPAGIHRIAITRNSRAARRSDEAVYYSQREFHPYDYNLARQDANAGWIASAVDLARFGAHVDGFSSVPDILSPDAVRKMTDAVISSQEITRDAQDWNWVHTGKMSGCCTAALLVLRNPEEEGLEGNYVLSVLINTESPKSTFMDERTRLPREVAGAVEWPSYDLFNGPSASDTVRAQAQTPSRQEPPTEDGPDARGADDRSTRTASWPTDQFDPAVLPPGVDEYRTAATNLPDVSRRVFELTNEERTTRGRGSLEFNEQLTLTACRHNKDMFANDYAGHEDSDGYNPRDRVAREHRTFLGIAVENVFRAWGLPDDVSKKTLASKPTDWWMQSTGHRENLLDPARTHLGLCVTRKDDEIRATQLFVTPAGFLDEPLPWSMAPGETLSVAVSGSTPSVTVVRYIFSPPGADNVLSRDETQPFDGTLRAPSEPGRYQLKVLYTTKETDDVEFAAGPSIRVQASSDGGPQDASDSRSGDRLNRAASWPADLFAPAVLPPDVDEHNEAGTNLPDVSRRVGTLTNEERTARDRDAIEFNEQLSLIACRHNKDMLAHDYMAHEDSEGRGVKDRILREHRTLLVRSYYENVAYTSHQDDLASVFVDMWMDSQGHRENILRHAPTHLGACVTREVDKARSTQVFANVAGELDKPLPWSMSAGDSLVTTVHSPRPDVDFERYGFQRVDTDEELSFEETVPFNGTIRIPSNPGRYELKMIYKNAKDEGPSYLYSTGPRIQVTAP